MSQNIWENGVTGVWSAAADWSGGIPDSSTADATISVPGTYTVRLSSGTETVDSLTFANAAASFDLGSTLVLGGILSNLTFEGDEFVLRPGAEISGDKFDLESGSLIYTGGNVATSDFIEQSGSTIYLGDHTFVLAGTSELSGVINGGAGGVLEITGSASFSGIQLLGLTTLVDAGTITDSDFDFGIGSSSEFAPEVVIEAGATFIGTGFDDGYGYGAVTPGTLINAGLLEKAGPAGFQPFGVSAFIENTGTILDTNGGIALIGGGILGGTLAGGHIELRGGIFTLSPTLAIDASLFLNGGSVTLERNLDLSKHAIGITSGGINLNGYSATLSNTYFGNGDIYGNDSAGSTLVLDGDNEFGEINDPDLGARSAINGNATLVDVGTITQDGVLYLGNYFPQNAADTSSLKIESGATYDLSGDAFGYNSTEYSIQGFDTGPVVNAGLFEGTGTIQPSFENTGSVVASVGDILKFDGNIMNLVDGTLTGGTWEASSAQYKPTVLGSDVGTALTTDAANIVLSGTGAEIEFFQTIESSLTSIAAVGTLQNIGGRVYSGKTTITDSGAVVLGGIFGAPSISITSGGVFEGSGAVDAPVQNDGTIIGIGGSLNLAGAVSGSGTIEVGQSSEVLIRRSLTSGETAEYLDNTGTLVLTDPSQFGSSVHGFEAASIDGIRAGDVLEILGTAVTGVSFGPHTLVITASSGIYDFTDIAYAAAVDGYTTTLDATTGLAAITFTEKDIIVLDPPASASIFANTAARISSVSITGTPSAGETYTVKLTDRFALLSASGPGVSGTNTTALTISGSFTQVNADLATLSDDSDEGFDRITLTASDSQGGIAIPAIIGVTATYPTITSQITLGSGQIATNLTIGDGGNEVVEAGARTYNIVPDAGAIQVVLPGGTTTDTVLEGGVEVVFGTANRTQVNSGSSDVVAAGGVSIGANINHGGAEYVLSGGTAANTTIYGAGAMLVGNGGATTGSITFAGSDAILSIAETFSPGAVISGFDQNGATNDSIILPSFTYASDDTATLVSGGILTLNLSGQTEKINLNSSETNAGHSFSVITNSLDQVVVIDPITGTSSDMDFLAPQSAVRQVLAQTYALSSGSVQGSNDSALTAASFRPALQNLSSIDTQNLYSAVGSSLALQISGNNILTVLNKLATHSL